MKYPYWYWKKFFQLKEIKNINKYILNNYNSIESSEKTAKNLNGENKKNVKCYLINYGKVKNLISNSLNNFFEINNYHFGFDLYPLLDLTNINYNIYTSEDKSNYDWHLDFDENSEIADIKLTCIINLSDNKFEGGNFLLNNGNEIVIEELKEPGSMIMFRSYFLHKVTPVTLGTRKTLTIFLYGPRMK
jgi:PKHD-type hydroxylase